MVKKVKWQNRSYRVVWESEVTYFVEGDYFVDKHRFFTVPKAECTPDEVHSVTHVAAVVDQEKVNSVT